MTAPSVCDFSCNNAQLKWVANQLTIASGSDPVTMASIATDMGTLLSSMIAGYTALIQDLTLTYPDLALVNAAGYIYGLNTQNQLPFAPMRVYPSGSAPTTPGFVGREGVYNAELKALNSALSYVSSGSSAAGLITAASILQAVPVRN